MVWEDLIGYILTFIFGGAVGSLITIKVRSDANTVQQNNNNVNNGNIVGCAESKLVGSRSVHTFT